MMGVYCPYCGEPCIVAKISDNCSDFNGLYCCDECHEIFTIVSVGKAKEDRDE